MREGEEGWKKRRRRMIPPIRKILFATDLTKNSSYAFYFAVDLAQSHDARIVILHCMAPIQAQMHYKAEFKSDAALETEKAQEKEHAIAAIKQDIREFCLKAESQLGCPCVDLVANIIVKVGHAVENILNTADEEECDVIVLGTHGKGWLRQAFLGSVAHSVLERTRKPVFIIPLPSEKRSIETGTA
jgi:nucleotide-binding universal stress UspA family protein